MYDDLFEFLEADLAGAAPVATHGATVGPDPLSHAVELVNSEWTDEEAAHEIARYTSYDELRQAQVAVIGGLMRNPLPDPFGIRLSRILWRAIDEVDPR